MSEKKATIDEALESYKILQIWNKAVCIISAFLVCAMIGFVIWGIFFAELRWILMAFGIAIGISGIALYFMVHRLYYKASSAILDYYKTVEKLSETRLIEKAKELKIPIKANKTK